MSGHSQSLARGMIQPSQQKTRNSTVFPGSGSLALPNHNNFSAFFFCAGSAPRRLVMVTRAISRCACLDHARTCSMPCHAEASWPRARGRGRGHTCTAQQGAVKFYSSLMYSRQSTASTQCIAGSSDQSASRF